MSQKESVTVALTAVEIEAIANEWLDEHLSDRFVASRPVPDTSQWRVPVLLAYPGIVVGQVGEMWISFEGEVVKTTDPDLMKSNAQTLAQMHHAEIEAAFLRTRNP
jgi:hypothetical protein